jgi:hypothetical protein
MSLSQLQENRERVRLSDKELERAVRENASAPLFLYTRYPEPYDELNPTIQVVLRNVSALADRPPGEILALLTKSLQTAYADFKLVTPVESSSVGGLDGAHMRATYTIENDAGQKFEVLSRMWIIPRTPFLFMIGMSGPPSGPNYSEDEFKSVLDSIRITE